MCLLKRPCSDVSRNPANGRSEEISRQKHRMHSIPLRLSLSLFLSLSLSMSLFFYLLDSSLVANWESKESKLYFLYTSVCHFFFCYQVQLQCATRNEEQKEQYTTLQPSSGVSCRTREPTRNFKPRPLFNSQRSLTLIPLTINGCKC